MTAVIAEFVEPEYRSDLNEGLGGSIELHEQYLFPVELPAGKVREILEDQTTGSDATVRGSRFPHFSLEIGEGKQYDLLYSFGKEEPVDAIAFYDSENGDVVRFYELENLID